MKTDNYPNPWNFSNVDKNLTSPNGRFRIEFEQLNEIAMGAPIGGECYLITPMKKIKLNDWSGGPIQWDTSSKKIAIPIWVQTREQKIGIADVESKSMIIYSKIFRILDLRTFDKNIITGYDSPIYKTTSIEFDTLKEKIEEVITLG